MRAAALSLVLAACAPAPTRPPEDEVQPPARDNLCGFLALAESDTVYELTGTHETPYDLDDETEVPPRDATGAGDHACYIAPTATNVTIRAAPGANPLFVGVLVLYGAKGWVFDNIDFTHLPVPEGATTAAESFRRGGLLKFVGGSGWKVLNSELFFPSCENCGDFAELSFGFTANFATPTGWEIRGNWFHDNPGCVGQPFCASGTAQSKFQNHHLYGIGAPDAPQNGVIRDNLFVSSPNGFAIKLGGSGSYDGSQGVREVLVENNTVVQSGSQPSSPAPGQRTGMPVLIDDDSANLTFRRNVFHEVSTGASDDVATLALGTGHNVFGRGFSTGIVFDDNVMTAPTSAVVLYFQGCAAELLPRSPSPTSGFSKSALGCANETAILSLTNTVDGSALINWPDPTPGHCASYGPITHDGKIYGAPASACTGG